MNVIHGGMKACDRESSRDEGDPEVIPGHRSANEARWGVDKAHRGVDKGLPDVEKVVRRLDGAPPRLANVVQRADQGHRRADQAR